MHLLTNRLKIPSVSYVQRTVKSSENSRTVGQVGRDSGRDARSLVGHGRHWIVWTKPTKRLTCRCAGWQVGGSAEFALKEVTATRVAGTRQLYV